jgi:hypothetical protein
MLLDCSLRLKLRTKSAVCVWCQHERVVGHSLYWELFSFTLYKLNFCCIGDLTRSYVNNVTFCTDIWCVLRDLWHNYFWFLHYSNEDGYKCVRCLRDYLLHAFLSLTIRRKRRSHLRLMSLRDIETVTSKTYIYSMFTALISTGIANIDAVLLTEFFSDRPICL